MSYEGESMDMAGMLQVLLEDKRRCEEKSEGMPSDIMIARRDEIQAAGGYPERSSGRGTGTG